MSEIPEKVWVIGKARPSATYRTPIQTGQGEGMAPLTVVDRDGERARPVFTTRFKAERGIRHFMSAEERADGPIASVSVDLGNLLRTFRGPQPEGTPKVDYIGVDMGEGGIYPLIRL